MRGITALLILPNSSVSTFTGTGRSFMPFPDFCEGENPMVTMLFLVWCSPMCLPPSSADSCVEEPSDFSAESMSLTQCFYMHRNILMWIRIWSYCDYAKIMPSANTLITITRFIQCFGFWKSWLDSICLYYLDLWVIFGISTVTEHSFLSTSKQMSFLISDINNSSILRN